MLTWKTVDGDWFANGFRIQRSPTGKWALYESKREAVAAVAAEPIPLASLPTLSACKYKAEDLHERRLTNSLRQRLTVVAIGAASLVALGVSNPLVVMLLGVIAMAAALELAMTWFDDRVGGTRDVFQ